MDVVINSYSKSSEFAAEHDSTGEKIGSRLLLLLIISIDVLRIVFDMDPNPAFFLTGNPDPGKHIKNKLDPFKRS